jgi:Transposase/MftR C-terminal domain
MDLHRRRSVLVRMTEDGRKLGTSRISNSPAQLAAQIARAGQRPRVVLEACHGWYWAADALAAAGAEVHLAHPLGVKAYAYRRVKNDELDAGDLADLLRMGRLPEAWIAPALHPRMRQRQAGWAAGLAPILADRLGERPDDLEVRAIAAVVAAAVWVAAEEWQAQDGRAELGRADRPGAQRRPGRTLAGHAGPEQAMSEDLDHA